MTQRTTSMDSRTALARLVEGNRRYVANVRGAEAVLSQVQRAELVEAQFPIAVVLGCSDSRVPAEIVFDQGPGDLFVVRVAGNIVAPSQLGSIEFASESFGTRLVVVLGHSRCSAVRATLDHVLSNADPGSVNILSIVNRIRPTIEPLVRIERAKTREDLLNEAVRANVRASANHVRYGTAALERLVGSGDLLVVGAEYDLVSGAVDFFDGV
jgi:carbonic anhydrase